MDRQVVDALKAMPEHNRFIRGMTSWVGFRQTGVYYVRQERHAGETKYPLRKMLRFALDAITGFSYFPLQITIYVSLILALLAVLGIPIVAFLRLSGSTLQFEGQATTLVIVLLMSSFQLFFFFVMGQYVARIYDVVRQRPLYIVSVVWEDSAEQVPSAVADAALPNSGSVFDGILRLSKHVGGREPADNQPDGLTDIERVRPTRNRTGMRRWTRSMACWRAIRRDREHVGRRLRALSRSGRSARSGP